MNWERFQIAAEVGFRKLEIDIEVMFIPERSLLEFMSKMVQVFQQRQSCLMKHNSQLEGVDVLRAQNTNSSRSRHFSIAHRKKRNL